MLKSGFSDIIDSPHVDVCLRYMYPDGQGTKNRGKEIGL